MARPSDADLVTLGPWARGENNIAREDSVPHSAFRSGVNVDVYPGGKVRRRPGSTLVDSTPLANLWSDGTYALATSLDSTQLFSVVPGAAPEVIFTGLAFEADVVYCSVNSLIYVSDGVIALRVDPQTNSVRPWGVVSPAAQPALTAIDGDLDPGIYQVAVTYLTKDGEESGTGLAANIDLTGPSYTPGVGINATLPAMPVPAYVAYINLYVTRPNGGDFRFYGQYPIGVLNVNIQRQRLGRELRTSGLEPMPGGSAAGLVGGRLAVVNGALLVLSAPLFYGLTNFATNVIPYPSPIDVMAPTALGAMADGVFIAAGDKTYFLPGASPLDAGNKLAYASGAVPCTPIYVSGDNFGIDTFPSQPLPVWLAKNGYVVVGLPTGQVVAPTNSRYAMSVGNRAVLAQRGLDGVEQIVVGVRDPVTSALVTSGDSADAVLVRNGIAVP